MEPKSRISVLGFVTLGAKRVESLAQIWRRPRRATPLNFCPHHIKLGFDGFLRDIETAKAQLGMSVLHVRDVVTNVLFGEQPEGGDPFGFEFGPCQFFKSTAPV